jgi:hypothetical protein
MSRQPIGNCCEVAESAVSIDNLHCARNFANAASTSCSEAARSAIDAGLFLGCRLLFAVVPAGIQVARDLGEFVLDVIHPCSDALQYLCQLCCLNARNAT